jgi:CheY-like chemotaxis protein
MTQKLTPFQQTLIKLSEPSSRGKLFFFILLFASIIILVIGFSGESNYEMDDKQKHFTGGKWASTLVLTIGYLIIAMVMFLRPATDLISRLIWLPALFCVIAGVGMGVVIFLGVSKEALDSTGMGNVEAADITATLEGGYAPNYFALMIMMALSPALIPLDLLLQLPQKWKEESLAHEEIDTYLDETKRLKAKNADILLLEDDIASATLVMKFLRKCKLSCIHVETISAARDTCEKANFKFKALIIDCFVRVESADDRSTGIDWVEEINQAFPSDQREFTLIMITGHPEQLGDRAKLADLVMKKPWDPKHFLEFLKSKSIVT